MTTQAAERTENQTEQGSMDSVLSETERRMREEMLARPELLQMRMENEAIMSECRLRPRNMSAIKAELMEQLQAFPDLAESSIYNKPVGKDDSGSMNYVEGLSVRAAETLAEAYGANRVRSDVTPIDAEGNRVKVEATFTDFQKCKIWQDGGIVSRTYKGRDGRLRSHSEDRFYNVVVKAEASKRVREVILRSVNAGLKAWFFNECKKVLVRLLSDDKVKEIVTQFRDKGVNLEKLEQIIGRPMRMGWTTNDRTLLIGLWNAIKDGETTIDEAFGRMGGQNGTGPHAPTASDARSANDKIADALEGESVKESAATEPEDQQGQQEGHESAAAGPGLAIAPELMPTAEETENPLLWVGRIDKALVDCQTESLLKEIQRAAEAAHKSEFISDDQLAKLGRRFVARSNELAKAREKGELVG